MSGANSTRFPAGGKPVEAKPEKPRRSFVNSDEEYPLTVHPAGYFSKKIRGRVHYFGRWDQGPKAAEQTYRERKEDLEAGRTPKADEPQGYTVKDLLNEYRAHKKLMWQQERITGRTYFDCVATCDFLFANRQEVIERVQALALRVLADRLEHGEPVPQMGGVFAVTP